MIDSAYILCHGIGNYAGFDNRVIDPSKDYVFQLFDYRSPVKEGGIRNLFYVCDWLVLLWDLKKFSKDTTAKSIQLSRPNRIKRLVELIKEYLTKTTNLTLIGVSHGSLLMHAAILRLQVELSPDLLRKFNTIIRFYTIGSPRHPLPQLLAKVTIANPINRYEYASYPLINFYHKDDNMLPNKALNIWGITRHPIEHKRTAQIVPLEETTPYTFNQNTSVLLHTGERVKKLSHYSKQWMTIDYHLSVYLLYPIWIEKRFLAIAGIDLLQYFVQISTPLYHLSILNIPIEKFNHMPMLSSDNNIYYAANVTRNLTKYKNIIKSHICEYNVDTELIYVTDKISSENTGDTTRKSHPKSVP